MRIQLPEKVGYIIRKLEEKGFEAFAVGGCVRDSVLGRTPADWDITTSAKPEQVKQIFTRTVDTGLEHGTVTVLVDKEGFEVTTYRIDGTYEDGRHPSEVCFTADLREDLRRRDFTINAMAYNESAGLVDIFGGIHDLEQGIIRCVGNAEERFGEDALRILRAVRFAAQLGFIIEKETAQAAEKLAETLSKISAERIRTELVKMLISPHPEMMRTAYELGMTRVFLPEFDRIMITKQRDVQEALTIGEHTLRALQLVDEEKVLRLSVLFHDFGKTNPEAVQEELCEAGYAETGSEMAVKIMRRLKFDNDTITKVKKIVKYHNKLVIPDKKEIRVVMNQAGKEIFSDLLQVRGADLLASEDDQKLVKLLALDRIHEMYEEVIEQKECTELKELAVSGKDLIAAGMKPGKEVGEVLQRMLDEVLEDPSRNTKEYLFHLSRR